MKFCNNTRSTAPWSVRIATHSLLQHTHSSSSLRDSSQCASHFASLRRRSRRGERVSAVREYLTAVSATVSLVAYHNMRTRNLRA